MKRSLKTLSAILVAFAVASCGNNAETASNENKEKIDTFSYVVGMEIANNIEKGVMPQLKADYNVIVNTMGEVIDGKESFTVNGVEFNRNNIMEIGMKYIGPQIQERVNKAMADSTGMTEVFSSSEEKEIASALIGADIAFSLETLPYEIKKESFMKAIKDIHDGKPAISENDAMDFSIRLQEKLMKEQQEKFTKTQENNRKESEAWLADIAKEEGVKKTASGILYKIVKEGDMSAKATKDTDIVKVLYTGTTRSGKVFDSNRWADMPEERKNFIMTYQPEMACDNAIEFPLNGVIEGWTEGMKLVGKGGRIVLWIPSELAYKERGAGADIGPNEALCFDVELLDVTPGK